MPRRQGQAAQSNKPVPLPVAGSEEVGYALGYRKPRMDFHETRQAAQYMGDLRAVLELTASKTEHTYSTSDLTRFFHKSSYILRRFVLSLNERWGSGGSVCIIIFILHRNTYFEILV